MIGGIAQLKEQVILENGIKYLLQFDHSHDTYKGHFPDSPITPGVVMIELVKRLVNLSASTDYLFGAIRQCKFTAPHNPITHQLMHITVKLSREEQLTVQAEGFSQDTVFFKLSGTLRLRNA